MKRRKIWLGLGAAAMVGGGAVGASALEAGRAPAMADVAAETAAAQPGEGRILVAAGGAHGAHGAATGKAADGDKASSAKAAGGEGEGVKKADVDPIVHFNHNLALIRGHLLVGDELVKEGKWNDAMVHFMHPSEEIYGNMAGDLKTFGVAPFAASLKALAQTVKAKNKDAYRAAWATVDQRLSGAEAAVRAKTDNYPRLMMETMLEVLGTASGEYEAAVGNGTIKEVVEYQDSRGFVWQAEKMIEAVGADLEKKDADAFKALKADLAELKQAWPTAVPPQKPVKDIGDVLSGVSKVELHAGRLM